MLVALGGAGVDLAGTCIAVGPVLLARRGAAAGAGVEAAGATIGSPPIRSSWGFADWPADALRTDSRCSTFCFSFTTLSGTSSSPSASRVAGSGIGPSITHRFSSYLVRMKFSILASDGMWPGANFASQYLFARALPQLRTLCSCSSVQESRSTDLTRLMWVPIPRWMPEQRMQMKTPRFQLAHRGSGGRHVSALREMTDRERRTFVALAVGAHLVGLELEEILDRLLVLSCPLGSGIRRSSRHGEVMI